MTFPPDNAISRRQFGRLGAAIVLALPATLDAARTAFAAGEGEEPRRGGTLIMTTAGDPSNISPDVNTVINDVIPGSLVYEGLVRLDESFKPVANLAKSWTVSPDGLHYIFQLVATKWHDGKDFTSSDVKFTLENVSKKYGPKFAFAASHIKSIATPEPDSVEIELNEPFGPFLFSLSDFSNAAILPEHIFSGTDILNNPAMRSKPVGTGPFMLTELASGDHISFERNPNYWRPGRPYLDRIVLKEIPDASARVLALRAGEVDYCYFYYFPLSNYQEVASDPQLQIRERGVPEDHLIVLNVRRPPFSDAKVRQALFTAVDREFLKKTIFQSLGEVMNGFIDTRFAWAHNPEVDLSRNYPYDPERAGRMLDEAGLKPDAAGKRFDLRFNYDSTYAGNDQLGEALKSMWGKVGVNVILLGNPLQIHLKQVFIDWDFDAAPEAYTTAGDPAAGIARLYVSSAIRKAPYVNASGYSNNKVDALFDAGAKATDLSERGRFYREAETILARDLPNFPIWQTALINVASKRVRGKWAWSSGYEYWEDVWIEG